MKPLLTEASFSEGEVQILDYRTQQYRLLPQLARSFAFLFAGYEIRATYLHVSISFPTLDICTDDRIRVTISLFCTISRSYKWVNEPMTWSEGDPRDLNCDNSKSYFYRWQSWFDTVQTRNYCRNCTRCRRDWRLFLYYFGHLINFYYDTQAVITWEVAQGIEQLRLSCGGHGRPFNININSEKNHFNPLFHSFNYVLNAASLIK